MRLHHLGEAGILREEAVAGMDRLGAGVHGRGDDCRDVQVAPRGGRRPDADRIVREPDVQRLGVGGRRLLDRLCPELVQRADHADRDLSAVGDEDLAEHGS